ncbi:MAG: cytochrome b/b6 domain-containing protein [Gammaproteobacteria bacterium]|nr:MAG: cytochrome b/b6 domain-containing protein [Gammaproteobacteria bacterium]
MSMLKFFKIYFGNKFTPLVRYLHYLILVLVLCQIVISNFLEVSDDGVISRNVIEYYGTWTHISIGLLLLFLAIIFLYVELSKHGFSYFYPYLSGDISQLKSDISQLKSLGIPEAEPKGLAAIIQGLGFGALLLVVLSGSTWFLMWSYDSPLTNDVKEIHELLTGLIEAYVIGHGSLGLIHIFITYKKQKYATK